MSLNFLHHSAVGRGGPQQVRAYLIDWRADRRAARACCCPAKPVVIVVMPPTPGRPHQTDLLLCGHHYRVSRQALAAAGATVVDIDAAQLADGAQPAAHAGV